jgi:hypothetical protein
VDLYCGKNIEINPGISRTILHQETSNISFLKKDSSFFRVYASSAMNKHNEALRGATYEEAFAKSIDNLSSNRLMEYGIFDARGYFSIHNSNYSKVLNLADTAPLPSSTNVLNMLNVKYILTLKEVDDPRSKLVNRGIESFLYENLDCLPRAYLVSGYRVIKDEAAMAKMLSSKDFKPQELVILEEEPQICAAPQASRRRGGLNLPYDSEGGESVQILSYHSNEVAIDAHVAGRGKFLVLADNYYPGWEVFVDGQKAKLHKANFVLRAVYLLPGSHRVAFRFNPVSFKWGCFISLATLAALAIAYFYGIMKPRDKKP